MQDPLQLRGLVLGIVLHLSTDHIQGPLYRRTKTDRSHILCTERVVHASEQCPSPSMLLFPYTSEMRWNQGSTSRLRHGTRLPRFRVVNSHSTVLRDGLPLSQRSRE